MARRLFTSQKFTPQNEITTRVSGDATNRGKHAGGEKKTGMEEIWKELRELFLILSFLIPCSFSPFLSLVSLSGSREWKTPPHCLSYEEIWERRRKRLTSWQLQWNRHTHVHALSIMPVNTHLMYTCTHKLPLYPNIMLDKPTQLKEWKLME